MINIDWCQTLVLGLNYPATARNFLLDSLFFGRQLTEFPRLINCFITERCNFNCPMCHVWESRFKNMAELSYGDIQTIVSQSKKFSPSFQLTGGEPLLHPRLGPIIKLLSKHKMPKGIVTNGLLLKENASMLVETGLDFLAVSLDGPDEKTQYRRGLVKGSFDKIVQGVQAVKRARGRRLFPNIRIATVVTRENLSNFDQVLDIARELGADQWSLSHYFYCSQKIKAQQRSFARRFGMGREVWGEDIGRRQELFNRQERNLIKEKYKKIIQLVREGRNGIRISFQPAVDIDKYYSGVFPSRRSVCTSPYNQIFIRGNGDLEMCQGYILGNIRRQKLVDIWRGEKAGHFRQVFKKVKIMPACFRCCALNIRFD